MDSENLGDPQSVVAIRQVGKGRKRVVELSNGSHLTVSDEAVQRTGLRSGARLTTADQLELEKVDRRVSAHEATLRLLSTRARSERELRTRLSMRGVDAETIDAEMDRLRLAGLVDDSEFARAWVAHRQVTAPRGRRMLRYELLGKGVSPDEVAKATGEVDDQANAIDVARRKTRSWTTTDHAEYTKRLGSFLQRRGFAYDVAAEATRTVWNERPVDDPD